MLLSFDHSLDHPFTTLLLAKHCNGIHENIAVHRRQIKLIEMLSIGQTNATMLVDVFCACFIECCMWHGQTIATCWIDVSNVGSMLRSFGLSFTGEQRPHVPGQQYMRGDTSQKCSKNFEFPIINFCITSFMNLSNLLSQQDDSMVRIIQGNRNGRILLHRGHRYRRNQMRAVSNIIYWKCWRDGCGSKLQTNFFNVNAENPAINVQANIPPHNHPAKDAINEQGDFIDQLRDEIRQDPTQRSGQAYNRIVIQQLWVHSISQTSIPSAH